MNMQLFHCWLLYQYLQCKRIYNPKVSVCDIFAYNTQCMDSNIQLGVA